jgi:Xaa-Pro dipeptidase
MRRRDVLTLGAAAAVAAAMSPERAWSAARAKDLASDLEPMTGGVEPIGKEEFAARLAKARALMAQHGIGALLVEPGSSLVYFTGIEWWRSERITAAVIPRQGEVAIVTPHFEEPSIRESLAIAADVRVWHEDANPLEAVADILRARKVTAPVGVEETVRYFVVDGLRKALPDVKVVNGAPVVRGCRMIKSAPEIALMQKAADITLAAFRFAYRHIEAGMTPGDIDALIAAAHRAYGASYDDGLVLLGEASAYPHGSHKPQTVREGEVVLLDCGGNVHGYASDISRTFVFGTPNAEQRKVYEQVRQGQQIAFETARVGLPAGKVDDAVRAQYEKWGYGPRYALPGTPHRTGHGIGLDGHEPVNFVHGETTPLAPGMCFSDEPGLYLPGKFGIRLEDCLHMGPGKPIWFTTPPRSLDDPFG